MSCTVTPIKKSIKVNIDGVERTTDLNLKSVTDYFKLPHKIVRHPYNITTTLNGCIYLFGDGATGGTNISTVYKWDVNNSDKWIKLSSSMPFADPIVCSNGENYIYMLKMSTKNYSIYRFNGNSSYTNMGTVMSAYDTYDTTTMMCMVGTDIYIAARSSGDINCFSIYRFDTTNNSSTLIADTPVSKNSGLYNLYNCNSELYVMMSKSGYINISVIYKFNKNNNSWTTTSSSHTDYYNYFRNRNNSVLSYKNQTIFCGYGYYSSNKPDSNAKPYYWYGPNNSALPHYSNGSYGPPGMHSVYDVWIIVGDTMYSFGGTDISNGDELLILKATDTGSSATSVYFRNWDKIPVTHYEID